MYGNLYLKKDFGNFTNVVFHISDTKRRRWKRHAEAVPSEHHDRNAERVFLQELDRQLGPGWL